jgi:effector-binding domain-containing protein
MEIKNVDPKTVFYHREKATLKTISDIANREIPKLMEEAQKLRLQEVAPMEFHYFGCDDDPEAEFDVEIAMVVEKPVEAYDGKYHFKSTDAFKCATTLHKGNINTIGKTYEAFMPEIFKSGAQLGSETREVYTVWESPESDKNITEIQVGLN